MNQSFDFKPDFKPMGDLSQRLAVGTASKATSSRQQQMMSNRGHIRVNQSVNQILPNLQYQNAYAESPRLPLNRNSNAYSSPQRHKIINGNQSLQSISPRDQSRYEQTPREKVKKLNGIGVALNSSMTVRSGAIKEVAELSKNMVSPKNLFKVSVDEMVKSNKKTDDSFGVKGYEYVKYNPHLDKPTVYSIPKVSDKPKDYISVLQKQKKLIPSPNQYETGVSMAKGGKFFIPQGKTPTYFGQIVNTSKKTPGVGAYNTLTKSKILGNYTQKQPTGGMTDEAIFKGMSTPSHYPAIDIEKIKNRTQNCRITKPANLKPGDNKIVKDNSPSPAYYKKEDAYDKTQSTQSKFAFSKSPKKSITEMIIKKAKVVPGIGQYDITKSDRIATIGARKSYK